MKARARADSRMVAIPFSLVIALSGLWTASSAGALTPESRGPKDPERSCWRGSSQEQDGDRRPHRGYDLGYRSRSAATVQPVANSGSGSRTDCSGEERSGAASEAHEQADDRGTSTGASDSPEPGDTRSANDRRTSNSPASGGSSGRTPDPGSGAGRGTYSANPSGTSHAADNGGSGTGGNGPAVRSGADTNADGANSGGTDMSTGGSGGGGDSSGDSSGVGSSRGPSGGGRKASNGGRRSGGGAGAPRGPGRAGTGGNNRAPSGGTSHGPSDSVGAPADFRVAPAVPPSWSRPGSGVGGPRIASASLRAPEAALLSSPGILAPVVTLPSTAAAAPAAPERAAMTRAAAGPAGPLPRTGGEINASTVLALVLLALGGLLRRTARADRRSCA